MCAVPSDRRGASHRAPWWVPASQGVIDGLQDTALHIGPFRTRVGAEGQRPGGRLHDLSRSRQWRRALTPVTPARTRPAPPRSPACRRRSACRSSAAHQVRPQQNGGRVVRGERGQQAGGVGRQHVRLEQDEQAAPAARRMPAQRVPGTHPQPLASGDGPRDVVDIVEQLTLGDVDQVVEGGTARTGRIPRPVVMLGEEVLDGAHLQAVRSTDRGWKPYSGTDRGLPGLPAASDARRRPGMSLVDTSPRSSADGWACRSSRYRRRPSAPSARSSRATSPRPARTPGRRSAGSPSTPASWRTWRTSGPDGHLDRSGRHLAEAIPRSRP